MTRPSYWLDLDLTALQRHLLVELIRSPQDIIGPTSIYTGTARIHTQIALVNLELAQYIDAAGSVVQSRADAVKCAITDKGRAALNPRQLWRPKRAQLEEQCTSCPFRDGNNVEFGAIVQRLCAIVGEPFSALNIESARQRIRAEATQFGDFICHHTVYNTDMSLKSDGAQRQCPGASATFVAAGVELIKKIGR